MRVSLFFPKNNGRNYGNNAIKKIRSGIDGSAQILRYFITRQRVIFCHNRFIFLHSLAIFDG